MDSMNQLQQLIISDKQLQGKIEEKLNSLEVKVKVLEQQDHSRKIERLQEDTSDISMNVSTLLANVENLANRLNRQESELDKANTKLEAFLEKYIIKMAMPAGMLYILLEKFLTTNV